MTPYARRLFLLAIAVALGATTLLPPTLQAQGRGGGTVMFLSRRPPRDLPNIRAWAGANRTNTYGEDTASHSWRVTYIVFLNRAPNVAEVTVSWFHIERDGTRRYITNEPIALGDPGQRVFFYQSILRRGPGQFEPMENYEAVISLNDARGVRELARGRVGLVGQVERRSGVVDFTRETPAPR